MRKTETSAQDPPVQTDHDKFQGQTENSSASESSGARDSATTADTFMKDQSAQRNTACFSQPPDMTSLPQKDLNTSSPKIFPKQPIAHAPVHELPRFFYHFHTTQLGPCPYLPDRQERKIWTDLPRYGPELFDRLSLSGFRRSHMVAYRPACPQCRACVAVRIRVKDFIFDKKWRRIEGKNKNLETTIKNTKATAEQFSLFNQYITGRHSHGEMFNMGFLDYRFMIEDSPPESYMLEFRQPPYDGKNHNTLKAAALIDQLRDGVSAVYSFYDIKETQRSFGSYIILWLIRYALQQDLPYVYLGFWVSESPKMAYKARFKPLEGYKDNHWQDLHLF